MSSNRASHYRLTPCAEDDLEDIWRYTAETWSIVQADQYLDELVATFENIVAMPMIARERQEIVPPVRTYIHGAHVIVYRIEEDYIAIIRILGARQNWLTILSIIDS